MHKQLDLLSKGSLHEKPVWIKLFRMHKTQQQQNKSAMETKQNKKVIKPELQTQNTMVSWRWFGPGELTVITHAYFTFSPMTVFYWSAFWNAYHDGCYVISVFS